MAAEARLVLAVGLGAALGSVARYLCSLGMVHLLGPGFPWGTLTVNLLGSLLIGLYATLTEPGGRVAASPARLQFVLTGFCGGFTTFSVFSLETLLLFEQRSFVSAGFYVGLSLLLWLLAVLTGHRIGTCMNRPKNERPGTSTN
ncbi:MAG: fluoride efflux transporter FluC [Kiloniellaceae bacterium]